MSPKFPRVPQEGAGAGVGVGMLRGRGDPVVSTLLGFLISWFSKFQRFRDSKFQRFDVSMIPYYQNAIACFLEDIDLILKLFRKYISYFLEDIDPIFKISTKY